MVPFVMPISVRVDEQRVIMGDESVPRMHLFDVNTGVKQSMTLANKCAYSLCVDRRRNRVYAVFCAQGNKKASALEWFDL